MLKQPVTITVKESQLNYNCSYIELNPTKLGVDWGTSTFITFTTKGLMTV